ncbi:MAG: YfhO family protein, partial [Thermodesulfobacteriota bacterium]
LLALALRPRPPRVDPYRPAPWVDALRGLVAQAGGRISGPVALAPPLVSSVLGFRDLRAIDVLTPRDGWEFVSQLVAPSEGVVWILADPDPLVAATSPGASVADLRWVLAREELDAERLPAAVRSQTAMRRLLRLFAALDVYRIDTAALGGGIHESHGDRRFHWTCATPCRFELDLADAPRAFAAGFAASEPLEVEVEVRLRAHGGERRERVSLVLGTDAPWQDVWIEGADPADGPAAVVVDVRSARPGTVFVGGVGPTPGRAAEASEALAELVHRRHALERLRLRYRDDLALVYENPAALGEAWLASEIGRAGDLDEVRACLLAHADRAVACVADPGRMPAAAAGEAPGEVRVVASRAAALSLDASVRRDALVVVSRLDDPGWAATVDGKDADLVRVNGAMMGVVVPAGEHRVELRYRPWSLAAGLVVSLAALLVLLRVATRRGFGI